MYMRIRRHFFHDSSYLTRHLPHIAVKNKYLPDRVFISEIFAGNPFRNHYLTWHGKTRSAVTFQQFKNQTNGKSQDQRMLSHSRADIIRHILPIAPVG